jgi:hypothetical protein
MDRIHMAEDANQWRAPVNTAINFRVRQKADLSDSKTVNNAFTPLLQSDARPSSNTHRRKSIAVAEQSNARNVFAR